MVYLTVGLVGPREGRLLRGPSRLATGDVEEHDERALERVAIHEEPVHRRVVQLSLAILRMTWGCTW